MGLNTALRSGGAAGVTYGSVQTVCCQRTATAADNTRYMRRNGGEAESYFTLEKNPFTNFSRDYTYYT